jgi:23S rRNA (guanosine2251-2'-O)-methyltransferase
VERRDEQDLLYGVHPVEEALRGTRKILRIAVKDMGKERHGIVEAAKAKRVKVQVLPAQELDKLTRGGNHQGVVAFLEPYRYADFDDWLASLEGKQDVLVLLLDSLKDAGNLGAILRSALAAGCAGVVIPQDRAAGVTAAVFRASAGAADRIPVCRVVNLARAMEQLKEHGFWLYGTAADAKRTIWESDWTGKTGMVLGDEEKGIRRLVAERCDEMFSIPMPGSFESLNVSAAAAVCLFEAVRQRHVKGQKGR